MRQRTRQTDWIILLSSWLVALGSCCFGLRHSSDLDPWQWPSAFINGVVLFVVACISLVLIIELCTAEYRGEGGRDKFIAFLRDSNEVESSTAADTGIQEMKQPPLDANIHTKQPDGERENET